MSKLTVESIINIYGSRVKEIKAYNEAKRTKVEDFLQIEPVAFSLSDEPDVLRIYIDKESAEVSLDGTLEEQAAEVAKTIVDGIGKDLAGALVEYANLVKQLAEDLSDEQLEDSSYIKNLLGEQLPDWDWDDWYDLLKNVRQEKYKEAHEEQTAEKIFNNMPYFAKEAAQEALKRVLKAEKADKLFKLDAEADTAVEILWNIFYCCVADIKWTAKKYNAEAKILTTAERKEHKDLLEFLKMLREEMWKQGEILKLREKEA